jgi:hypothetical protein
MGIRHSGSNTLALCCQFGELGTHYNETECWSVWFCLRAYQFHPDVALTHSKIFFLIVFRHFLSAVIRAEKEFILIDKKYYMKKIAKEYK